MSLSSTAAASQIYVTNASSERVSAFSVGAGGVPAPIACGEGCATQQSPFGIAVTPNGHFVYVANGGGSGGANGTVSAYSVGPAGELAAIACGASNCETGGTPVGVAVSPSGQNLYVVNARSRSVSAFAIAAAGTLTPLACGAGCNTTDEPEGIAISPGGQYLYVSERSSSKIAVFAIGAGGALSEVKCSACTTEAPDPGLAITPNGRYLYASAGNSTENGITAFEIQPGGTLARIGCPGCLSTAAVTRAIAVSPSGRYVYADRGPPADAIDAYEIQPGGSLVQLACSPASNCATGGEDPYGLAVSPSGSYVYASNSAGASPTSGLLSGFAVGAAGILSPIGCPAEDCKLGEDPDFFSLAVSPDQGPTAAFTDTPAGSGSATNFNGSGSAAASEVTVAVYNWSFGDGSTAASGGPAPSHTYASPGTYTVTLTVTDSSGCSTQVIYTGQTASCNGSGAASVSHTVLVPAASAAGAAGPVLTRLGESHRSWRLGRAAARLASRHPRPPVGTSFSFHLNELARTTFEFTTTAAGRRSGGRCVAVTSRNRSKRRCTRTVVAGSLSLRAHAGTNQVSFDGALSAHRRLPPGGYEVSVTAFALGKRSATQRLRFTIVRS